MGLVFNAAPEHDWDYLVISPKALAPHPLIAIKVAGKKAGTARTFGGFTFLQVNPKSAPTPTATKGFSSLRLALSNSPNLSFYTDAGPEQ